MDAHMYVCMFIFNSGVPGAISTKLGKYTTHISGKNIMGVRYLEHL